MKRGTALACLLALCIVPLSVMAQGNKVVVVPLNTRNASSVPAAALPIAYGDVTYNGGSHSLYGVTSVAHPGTGRYTITLNKTVSGYPVVNVSGWNNIPNGGEVITWYSGTDTNIIDVYVVDAADNPLDYTFSFLVFGTISAP